MSDWGWVTGIVVPFVVAATAGLLGGGLVTFLIQRGDANRRLRRDGYSEAVAALYSWHEYPYQIKRRSSDDPENLDRLVQLGHENQQRLARSLAWVACDDHDAFVRYREAVDSVKTAAGDWVRDAWTSSPIKNASEMNLDKWGPPSIDQAVKDLLDALSERVH